MNPLDFTGPTFLLFYVLFSLCIIGAVWYTRRTAEDGPPTKLNLADPYLLAYLRAGVNETLRLAVVSLVERQLLATDGKQVKRTSSPAPRNFFNKLEPAILNKFRDPAAISTVFKDKELQAHCQFYREQLEQAGLLPDASTKAARWLRFSAAAIVLGSVGALKVAIGLSHERPVAFLLGLMAIAVFALIKVSFPRLTTRGQEALADARTLYGGLRDRAAFLRPGSPTAEVLMLAAVFGVGALSADAFGYARDLFPRAYAAGTGSESSSCGSSCSSSDGGSSCGSSCGGGGCGGCGGS